MSANKQKLLEIDRLQEGIKGLEQVQMAVGREISKLRTSIDKLHYEIIGFDRDKHVIGDWDCSESPIGICVYNRSDSRLDDCIYCHEPDERK